MRVEVVHVVVVLGPDLEEDDSREKHHHEGQEELEECRVDVSDGVDHLPMGEEGQLLPERAFEVEDQVTLVESQGTLGLVEVRVLFRDGLE